MNDGGLDVAVIGGGIAGVTAAYLLQQRHRVALFEKNAYLGGHTRTVAIARGPDAGLPVDTGFIVLNDRTYPLLNRLFRRLGVEIRPSDMSFSYCCRRTGLEYASRDLDSLFAQRRNLLDPTFWWMLGEILRFNRAARQGLAAGTLQALTLGRFLRRGRFGLRLQRQYIFPMVAAIWSAPDLAVEDFPMETFARFFHNHGLLALRRQPQWYYVAGGSWSYIRAFTRGFRGEIRTGAPVRALRRLPEGVALTLADGSQRRFDRAVVALHADEALRLLADPDAEERRLLGAWRYSANRVVLHGDIRWMPSNPRAWASWNVLRPADADPRHPVTLTYHMNRLQRLPTRHPYFVTLNPESPIAEHWVHDTAVLHHPVYTFASLRTQPELPGLNGRRHTWFCGSYFGFGFHEDGCRAGAAVGQALGVPL